MILKQRDIMIDLETLATGPDSVILTIGALRFDPYSNLTLTLLPTQLHQSWCQAVSAYKALS